MTIQPTEFSDMLSERRRWRKRGGVGGIGSAGASGLSAASQSAAVRWRVVLRVAYIGGVTLLTCALLLEGIFVRLLLIPYMRESTFSPAQCILRNTFYQYRAGFQRCESRCAKLASAFPCLVVRVHFLQPENKTWHAGFLFDQLKSFQKREPYFVSALYTFTKLH